jgi:hypothetical protein
MADAEKLSPVSSVSPMFMMARLVRARRAPATLALALALTAATLVQAGLPGGASAAEALAVSGAPSGGRKPPPTELRRLDYFRGTWICTGVMEPSGTSPAHLTNGKAVYKWDATMGGFFQIVTNQDDRTRDDPTPRSDRGYLGYEETTKEYTLAVFFVGGGRLIAAAPGWTGDRLKFVGDSTQHGAHMQIEELVTRKSDTEYLSELSGVGANGKMTRVFHEKCVRNGR